MILWPSFGARQYTHLRSITINYIVVNNQLSTLSHGEWTCICYNHDSIFRLDVNIFSLYLHCVGQIEM